MTVRYDEVHKTYYVTFRYTDWAGKSKTTTKRGFSTKREAVRYESEFKIKAAGLPTMTVRQLVDEMMESITKRLKPNSIRQKEMLYRLYIVKYLGDMQIAKITPRVIRGWQDNLPTNKSPATIQAANTAFKALLNYAVKYHSLPSNPFDIAGTTGSMRKRIEIWEASQFDEFLKVVDKPMYHAIFNLFFYSGLRRGELLALTDDDVDFKNNTIRVDKSMDDIGRVLPPKTKSSVREISIPQFVMDELRTFRDSFGEEAPKQFFPTTYALLKMYFTKYQKRTNLPHLSIHGLRHSHASYLIQNTQIPLPTLAKRLGHANANISLSVYSHCYKNSDADIAKMIDMQENRRFHDVLKDKKEYPQSQ